MVTTLIADDETGIRELLFEILGDEGHAVEVVENVQRTCEYRANATPDLILPDIWMSDTDGMTLLKEWVS